MNACDELMNFKRISKRHFQNYVTLFPDNIRNIKIECKAEIKNIN